MPLRIAEKAALTDVGRARQSNEDSYLERSPLFVVADGMGGARAGEVASAIAVETAGSSDVGSSPEQDLAEVAKSANREIYRKAQSDSEHAGMGTTFTGALVTGNDVAIGHVGDSRMYRYRDGELERLTQDHSLVEEFVRQGKLTPEEAEVHPQRSIITRALGPEPEVQVDTFTYPGKAGDIYLMCSDGLTGMISEATVSDILASGRSLQIQAKRLIDAANANGGRDNITVVLFRLAEEGDEGEGDHDTLDGQETRVGGVSAETVAAAVHEADAAEAGKADRDSGATVPREVPSELPPENGADEAEGAASENTVALRERPSEARTGRDDTRIGRTLEGGGVPATSPIAARRPPPVSRRRRFLAVAGIVLVLAIAVAALWIVDRQFWFVGTNDAGQVTLYQGLPYDLPLGVSLYSEKAVSEVPAAAITDRRQRRYVLDHHARGHGDSLDLYRQISANYLKR